MLCSLGRLTMAIPELPAREVAGAEARVRDTSGQDVFLDPDSTTHRRRRRLWIIGCAAAVLIVMASWIIGSWLHPGLAVPRARVRIATVTSGELVRDVAAEGVVVVANSPTLFAVDSGTVTFNVVAGAPV